MVAFRKGSILSFENSLVEIFVDGTEVCLRSTVFLILIEGHSYRGRLGTGGKGRLLLGSNYRLAKLCTLCRGRS